MTKLSAPTKITIILILIAVLVSPSLLAENKPDNKNDSPIPADHVARLRPGVRTRVENGLWNIDAYPNLPTLDAHKTVTIAAMKGPGQINIIHVARFGETEQWWETARSVILEVFFDDAMPAAVSVPLGDFFADGTGLGSYFSTGFLEKAPAAYNCYMPMPFKKSARITLRNDSNEDLVGSTQVEWQTLPEWQEDLGYFHASWLRIPFQLTPDTAQTFFRLKGPGHLVGEYWNINTDEPAFKGANFVMEGNPEHRVDGETEPSTNYLGSESSFNVDWGWSRLFNGYKNGTNYLSWLPPEQPAHGENKPPNETKLSVYRFRDRDVVRFQKSLELTINWTKELGYGRRLQSNPRSYLETLSKTKPEFRYAAWQRNALNRVRERNQVGGGWVDYAMTVYWYSADPQGLGTQLPPLDERLKPFLNRNPIE